LKTLIRSGRKILIGDCADRIILAQEIVRVEVIGYIRLRLPNLPTATIARSSAVAAAMPRQGKLCFFGSGFGSGTFTSGSAPYPASAFLSAVRSDISSVAD
jgi:hypothetical protein